MRSVGAENGLPGQRRPTAAPDPRRSRSRCGVQCCDPVKGARPIVALAEKAPLRGGVVMSLLALLALLAPLRCAGEERGTVQVSYRLQQQSGFAQSCADLGAESLELAFFEKEGDTVPYDAATFPCEAVASGRGSLALVVAAGHYAAVELRLLTSSGNNAYICTADGRVPAVIVQRDIEVRRDVLCNVEFLVIGDSTPCAE